MEDKPKRSIEEIRKEFAELALRTGQIQYQIHSLEKDLNTLNSAMTDLNFEAASVANTPKQEKTENEPQAKV